MNQLNDRLPVRIDFYYPTMPDTPTWGLAFADLRTAVDYFKADLRPGNSAYLTLINCIVTYAKAKDLGYRMWVTRPVDNLDASGVILAEGTPGR